MKKTNYWEFESPLSGKRLNAEQLAAELAKMAQADAEATYRLVDQYKTPSGVVKVYETANEPLYENDTKR